MIRHRNTDQGVEFFFAYQADRDAFVRFVEMMQEPIRDPDGTAATKRLLEIRQWCDKNDPYGATAAGFIVRLMRSAIDQRLYNEPQPRPRFTLPLIRKGKIIEDGRGVVVGTVDMVNLVNELWQAQDDPRGFDL